jgi:hypothetical protein
MSTARVVFGVLAVIVGAWLLNFWLRLRRVEFIRTYESPPVLLQKLNERHPEL